MTKKEDKEDKIIRQFMLYCRTALRYEKLNYYNEWKHRAAKLCSQIKGMTEKERRHRNIVWGSHFEYLLREKLDVSKEQLAVLDDDGVKDILNVLFADLSFRRAMQNILAEKVKQLSLTK